MASYAEGLIGPFHDETLWIEMGKPAIQSLAGPRASFEVVTANEINLVFRPLSPRYSAGTRVAMPRCLRRSPSINIAGVTINVSTVAITNPPAMADDNSVHHWVEGAP